MDTHSSHLTAANRSRSSQTPSPSHSASASATSSIHKRKLAATTAASAAASEDHAPPSFPPSSFSADTRDGALTSNDDLESISARGADSDSDPDESEDAVVDDEEDEFGPDHDNDSSIRTFTAARLDPGSGAGGGGSGRNAKLKAESSTVKLENSDGGKEVGDSGPGSVGPGAILAGSSTPGTVVKDDAVKIFTENLQTSGAYSAREESLKREEEAGRLKFACYSNDGIDEHMIWLIGLKNIFARQLPNMPKEYIVRLVMDRNHKSVMVIRRNHVVGGITYRPYHSQKFGEIAFCAITADEQVKGYGTRLMNHLKQHARDVDGLTHFLTYADNNAVGYFIKQGFTKEIHLEKERWQGYIKDYDGGILMECKIDPKLPYIDLSTMIRRQRQAIDEKIRELSNCQIVYSGLDFQKKEAGIPRKIIKLEDMPGFREAGWTPDQWGHSRFKMFSVSTESATNQKHLIGFMRSLLKSMFDHVDVWPFKDPVDARDVPDYYDIIKDPMDLKTMSRRVESEQYYVTLEMFLADVKRMFANARTYNSPDTIYYKCATSRCQLELRLLQAAPMVPSCHMLHGVAFIPYITAGDPDLSTTAEALKVLDSCGSDIIELGVPYSDPLADGPVIQAAATRSLARGTNFNAILSMLKEVVPQISCPIALFTYYNPILKRGTENFMSTIKDAGIHGLVVPDVPLEETETLRKEAVKNKIELVLLTTPTTPTDRMKAIVEASEGFVYLVSSTGVTGARSSVSHRVQSLLRDIKEATDKPVAVGFGISKPEHVKQIVGWGADGVIVGSAMVKLLGEAKSAEEGLKELEIYTKSLKYALL